MRTPARSSLEADGPSHQLAGRGSPPWTAHGRGEEHVSTVRAGSGSICWARCGAYARTCDAFHTSPARRHGRSGRRWKRAGQAGLPPRPWWRPGGEKPRCTPARWLVTNVSSRFSGGAFGMVWAAFGAGLLWYRISDPEDAAAGRLRYFELDFGASEFDPDCMLEGSSVTVVTESGPITMATGCPFEFLACTRNDDGITETSV